MTKYRALGLAAVLAAMPAATVLFELLSAQWAIILYPFMIGILFSLIQRETKTYRFVSGMLFGSVLFSGTLFLVAALRSSLMWPSIHGAYLSQFWSMAPIFGIVFVLSLFGGLFGIVLKGCYLLYPKWSERILLFVGPLLLMTASLFVVEAKIGGTVAFVIRGWPFPLLKHFQKDVLDGTVINRWTLESSMGHWRILASYLCYFAFLFGASFLAVRIRALRIPERSRRMMAMMVVLMAGIVVLSAAPSIQIQRVWKKLGQSQSCVRDEDCVMLGGHSAFSCAIAVNKDHAQEIRGLLSKVPAPEDTLLCASRMTSMCVTGRCEPVSEDFIGR